MFNSTVSKLVWFQLTYTWILWKSCFSTMFLVIRFFSWKSSVLDSGKWLIRLVFVFLQLYTLVGRNNRFSFAEKIILKSRIGKIYSALTATYYSCSRHRGCARKCPLSYRRTAPYPGHLRVSKPLGHFMGRVPPKFMGQLEQSRRVNLLCTRATNYLTQSNNSTR